MSSKLGNKSRIISAAAVLAAAPLLSTSMVAQAAPKPAPGPTPETLLTCELEGKATFSPGLSLNPAGQSTQMNVEGNATGCTSSSDLGVVSAKFTGSLGGQMSCTSLPRDVGGNVEITWTYKDGSTTTSTADFVLNMEGNLNDPSNPVTGAFNGTGTDGEFKGAKHDGDAKIDPASVAGGCLTGGLDSLEFDGKYEMTS